MLLATWHLCWRLECRNGLDLTTDTGKMIYHSQPQREQAGHGTSHDIAMARHGRQACASHTRREESFSNPKPPAWETR